MKSNGSKCEFNQICTPFSLPVQENIPVCGNEFDRVCHLELLTELMTMLQKDCKKLCHIKEYKYRFNTISTQYDLRDKYGNDNDKEYIKWMNKSWDWNDYEPKNSFILEYSFGIDTTSDGAQTRLRDYRSLEL